MNIVIIDSGISLEARMSSYINSVKGISIYKRNKEYVFSDNYSDELGHGTILTDIICKHIQTDVNLFFIKIFDSSLTVDVDLLIEALKYCEKNLSCDLIQISMGTLYSDGRLRDVIRRLHKRGVVIVSAFDNEKCLSYPAAYEEVIGVDIIREYRNISLYNVIKTNCVDIQGADIYYRVQGLDGKRVIVKGSSFYCSYITAMIANQKLGYRNKEICMAELQKGAQQVFDGSKKSEQTMPTVRKAVVFPFNKETHSLAAFEREVIFEVQDYFDVRQKGHMNRKVCDVLPYTSNEKVIQDIECIDWNSDFDTFICGHVGELSKLLGYDVLEYVLEKCALYSKQLICFDSITEYVKKYPEAQVWVPGTNSEMVPSYRFGKLRSPNVPIVGVFGTSSRQGKMTVQLLIRESFKKRKIRLKNIGSEPESLLFGFEAAYVFGYGATDSLMPFEMIQALNEMVYDLEKEECDMIVVGSQSGTVPHQLRNIEMIPIKQYCFLLGTQPDSIVLCVNGYDSEEYIKRTIAFFESTVNAKVICMVVSYMNLAKNHPAVKPISFFKEKFSLPVFDLKNLDVEGISETIVGYYSQ